MVIRNSIDINQLKPSKSIEKKTLSDSNVQNEFPINSKVPISISHFKINEDSKLQVESFAVFSNAKSFSFQSGYSFHPQSLLRVSISLPNYWQRKSKHVGYSHTYAPTSFQVLVRVVDVFESQRKTRVFDIVCGVVNIDSVDEQILSEFLL